MADLDERLNRLISDPESMKKVLEAAKAILAQRDGIPSESAKDPASPAPEKQESPASGEGQTSSSAEKLSQMLTYLSSKEEAPASPPAASASQAAPATEGQAAPSPSPLLAILPQLAAGFSGQGNLLRSERVDLINAMRPYLKEERAGNIDRALKMANATKAAMSAMHLLGR